MFILEDYDTPRQQLEAESDELQEPTNCTCSEGNYPTQPNDLLLKEITI